METMPRHTKNGLGFYSFKAFEDFPEMKHGVFTRFGPEGEDFNLSYEHGEAGAVNRNLHLAREALGVGPPAFVCQAHGSEIWEPEGYAPGSPEELVGGYDALIGREGAYLMVKLADCQGVILYSPGARVFALVHSGWRGSVLNILGKTVRKLSGSYGADPGGIHAGVSPSIGPCCMEFKSYREDLP